MLVRVDCREGLGGPQLEGYTTAVGEHYVETTFCEFVTALSLLWPALNTWVLPVCPRLHRSDKNGKAVGRAARRQVTQLWNEQLRRVMPCDKCQVGRLREGSVG